MLPARKITFELLDVDVTVFGNIPINVSGRRDMISSRIKVDASPLVRVTLERRLFTISNPSKCSRYKELLGKDEVSNKKAVDETGI